MEPDLIENCWIVTVSELCIEVEEREFRDVDTKDETAERRIIKDMSADEKIRA